MQGIDAFILIGGKSSRLGSDKAFVKLDRRTLLDRAVDAIQTGLSPTRVTAVGRNAEVFAIEAIASGLPFIFDLYENRGPLGGIHAALADAGTPWIFVLACDYPFVSRELIELLAAKLSDEFGAIVPEQKDGRLQPLCGFYKVDAALSLVEQTLERPRVTPPMHEVVANLNPLVVRFDEYAHLPKADELFININTPDDLDLAREIGRKLSPSEEI